MKYKICKFVNGIGEEWYQVQKKGWLFWSYAWAYKGGAPEFSPNKVILKFYTREQVQSYIKERIQYEEQDKIKKVECFDYVPES